MRVIILGAGPAGLAAAWHLSKEGAEVILVEMDRQVGGLCQSINHNGFIFDLGGHRFITKDNLLYREMEELMRGELIQRPRKSVVRLKGKYFCYPLQIMDLLKKMSPVISFKSGLDFFLTKLHHGKLPDVSFEDWVIRRFGRTMYNIYFGPYSQKLWGISPKEITSEWAAQRISLLNIWDVLFRALGRKKDMPKTYAENFLYPAKGIGRISERMKEEIEKNNGKICLNSRIKKVIIKNCQIERIIYETANGESSISGDFIVSTIPAPDFIRMIEPEVDKKVLETAKSMKFRAIKFLFITVNRPNISDNTWIYVPEAEYIFFRIQEMRNWSPHTVPAGQTALTLEIACNENDHIWNATDKDIFDKVINDLNRMGLLKKDDVIDYFVEKNKYAYPIYSIDYQEKIKTVYSYLAQIKKFISIGRQGLYRYNNMDHSLKMGFLTAKHIIEGYPRQKILEIATENIIFDWQDPGK